MIYLLTYFGFGLLLMTIGCIYDSEDFDKTVEEICDEIPNFDQRTAVLGLFLVCALIWPLVLFDSIKETIRDWAAK